MTGIARSTWRMRFGFGCAVCSAGLLGFTTICFAGLWDSVAAFTIFPQWSWALLGTVLIWIGWRLSRHRWMLVSLILWWGTVLIFSDNLSSLLRMRGTQIEEGTSPSIKRLRIVTLNCAGKAAAAKEVAALKPDLVLLQEIPSTNELAQCSQLCFGAEGAFVSGFDCAILFPEKIERSGSDTFPPQFIRAQVQLKSGKTILVTSLRLIPPEGRLDLWNPEAWHAASENRRLRRTQLQAALERSTTETDLPEILGGDFNAPASDSVFRLLSRFRDAHGEAGTGWGNTAINSFPIARPDQIWVKGFRVISTRASRTRNSDHRLVLVELEEVD